MQPVQPALPFVLCGVISGAGCWRMYSFVALCTLYFSISSVTQYAVAHWLYCGVSIFWTVEIHPFRAYTLHIHTNKILQFTFYNPENVELTWYVTKATCMLHWQERVKTKFYVLHETRIEDQRRVVNNLLKYINYELI